MSQHSQEGVPSPCPLGLPSSWTSMPLPHPFQTPSSPLQPTLPTFVCDKAAGEVAEGAQSSAVLQLGLVPPALGLCQEL